MKHITLLLSLLTLTLSTSLSQTPNPNPTPTPGETESNPAFWQAKFDNGGHYLVKLSSISSASKHEYIANGSARVIEVTIAASGAVVARFYYLEPIGANSNLSAATNAINRVQNIAQTTANKIAPNAGNIQVIKDYPNTTHAHTVEYALQSETALTSLYQSLHRAVENNRGRTWQESVK